MIKMIKRLNGNIEVRAISSIVERYLVTVVAGERNPHGPLITVDISEATKIESGLARLYTLSGSWTKACCDP